MFRFIHRPTPGRSDLSRERVELEADPAAEHRELTAIYLARGLELG